MGKYMPVEDGYHLFAVHLSWKSSLDRDTKKVFKEFKKLLGDSDIDAEHLQAFVLQEFGGIIEECVIIGRQYVGTKNKPAGIEKFLKKLIFKKKTDITGATYHCIEANDLEDVYNG